MRGKNGLLHFILILIILLGFQLSLKAQVQESGDAARYQRFYRGINLPYWFLVKPGAPPAAGGGLFR
ncbi:MAG: hypothetical protein ACUVRL_01625 [Candidatus Saccharicenans sp.]|uniref:hypothetical protein n=1 Tax=Candidatus Saccharicenans sp. TaxID=2819258 RepID=UPI004048F32D